MNFLSHIFNREAVTQTIVHQQLQSISNHCTTSAFDLAYLVEKMDKVLKNPEYAKHLDDDEVIDIGVARERIAAAVQTMLELNKKI